jgi:acyl-CoA reductase-like NAD-dependent aldehyde dehydrogenase
MEVATGEVPYKDASEETKVASMQAASHIVAPYSWATYSMQERLAILRKARHVMASMTTEFADAISPNLARTKADTLVAELLPLLEAGKYLERNAARILAPRRLGRRGLPYWLSGVNSEVQRAPVGTILIIGPSNYPLFLPGVQALQALAAGNQVIWKPGREGKPVADLFRHTLIRSGLPATALQVTNDTVAAGEDAIRSGVDKVIFTGSADNARAVLHAAAERLTPCVIEASGCDAVIVLESADVALVTKALAFGMRLNGSATCMAPRRILLVGASPARKSSFETSLLAALEKITGIPLSQSARDQLKHLIADAVVSGATLHSVLEINQRPILVTNVKPHMAIARSDIFAPLLSIIDVGSLEEIVTAQQECSFGLTAAIFGDEREARSLGKKLNVGTVIINDLIVSTADPRVPFTGRRMSGFGATRGAEGLLEMTTPKTIIAKRSPSTRQYDPTGITHESLFDGMIHASHAGSLKQRWSGVKKMIRAGRELGRTK